MCAADSKLSDSATSVPCTRGRKEVDFAINFYVKIVFCKRTLSAFGCSDTDLLVKLGLLASNAP